MPLGDTTLGGSGRVFPETVGTLIGRVASPTADGREEALAEFCRGYWKPVYSYLRSSWAKSNEDAKDLTQAFFLWLYEDNPLQRYEAERGMFRAYLKSLLKHFVQHHDEALRRLKRGGHLQFVAFEESDGTLPENLSADPDKVFDEMWRNQVLERAIDQVQRRCRESGREIRFRVFQEYDGAPDGEQPTYRAVAERLGIKETDVHNYLVAVREELRTEIRAELSRYALGPEGLEEEWRDFFSGS